MSVCVMVGLGDNFLSILLCLAMLEFELMGGNRALQESSSDQEKIDICEEIHEEVAIESLWLKDNAREIFGKAGFSIE